MKFAKFLRIPILNKVCERLLLTNEKMKVRNFSVGYLAGYSLERQLVATLSVYPNIVWYSWYSLIMIKICI